MRVNLPNDSSMTKMTKGAKNEHNQLDKDYEDIMVNEFTSGLGQLGDGTSESRPIYLR